jgi:hypothetical protein
MYRPEPAQHPWPCIPNLATVLGDAPYWIGEWSNRKWDVDSVGATGKDRRSSRILKACRCTGFFGSLGMKVEVRLTRFMSSPVNVAALSKTCRSPKNRSRRSLNHSHCVTAHG